MPRYWPSQAFFACLWTETESRSINSQKIMTRQARRQYQAILTVTAWSIKGLLYYFQENLSSGTITEAKNSL